MLRAVCMAPVTSTVCAQCTTNTANGPLTGPFGSICTLSEKKEGYKENQVETKLDDINVIVSN